MKKYFFINLLYFFVACDEGKVKNSIFINDKNTTSIIKTTNDAVIYNQLLGNHMYKMSEVEIKKHMIDRKISRQDFNLIFTTKLSPIKIDYDDEYVRTKIQFSEYEYYFIDIDGYVKSNKSEYGVINLNQLNCFVLYHNEKNNLNECRNKKNFRNMEEQLISY